MTKHSVSRYYGSVARRVAVTINLLPKDPFFDTVIGKVLRWALSVGRYIVIFTELIVIMSFAARFSLDRQITDLNDSINQKATIVDSFGELEANVREAQTRIEQYRQISQQNIPTDIFLTLSNLTPKEIKLSDLSINNNRITIEGTALSSNTLNIFINNIQLSPEFTKVTVDSIQSGDNKDPGYRFRIQLELKTVAPVASPPTRRTTGGSR